MNMDAARVTKTFGSVEQFTKNVHRVAFTEQGAWKMKAWLPVRLKGDSIGRQGIMCETSFQVACQRGIVGLPLAAMRFHT